ncbi:MAG: hypothetical protein AAFU64_02305 [Bacteroidota bacterium]
MNDIFCPHCGFIHQPPVHSISRHFVPTGGDYDFMECPAKATCQECGHVFEVRVQVGLSGDTVYEYIYFPYPEKITMYAVTDAYGGTINIRGFYRSSELAIKALEEILTESPWLGTSALVVQILPDEILTLEGSNIYKKKTEYETLHKKIWK